MFRLTARFCLPLLLLALLTDASAETASLYQAGFNTRIIEHQAGYFILEFQLDEVTLVPVKYAGEEYHAVELAGGGWLEQIGAPDLPCASRLVALPDLSDWRVTLLDAEYTTQNGVDVFPVQEGDFTLNPQPGRFQRDANIYQRNAF